MLYLCSQREKILQSIFYACSVASLVAEILSKENAVVGIPLILLYNYFFLSRFDTRKFGMWALAIVGIENDNRDIVIDRGFFNRILLDGRGIYVQEERFIRV